MQEYLGQFTKDIEHINSFFLEHPEAKAVLDALDMLFHYGPSLNADHNYGFVLSGPPGSGKTATLGRFTSKHPMAQGTLGDVRPVLYVDVPSPCTVKTLAEEILIQLGDIPNRLGTLGQFTFRIHKQLRDQGVKVVILDECQNLVIGASSVRALANWVKRFLNMKTVGIVMSGTDEYMPVVRNSMELDRRSFGKKNLRALDWNNPTDRKLFLVFLKNFEDRLPFTQPSELTKIDNALRFHACSKGLVGYVSRLITKASLTALHEGKNRLDHEVLLRTSDSLLEEHEWPTNPFRLSDPRPGNVLVAVDEGRSTRLRPKRGKPSASDVMDGKASLDA